MLKQYFILRIDTWKVLPSNDQKMANTTEEIMDALKRSVDNFGGLPPMNGEYWFNEDRVRRAIELTRSEQKMVKEKIKGLKFKDGEVVLDLEQEFESKIDGTEGYFKSPGFGKSSGGKGSCSRNTPAHLYRKS